MSQGLTLTELQANLGGVIRGDGTVSLTGVASLENAGPGQLGFVMDPKLTEVARNSAATALITSPVIADALSGKACLVVDKPHVAFAQAVALLHPEPRIVPGIHPTAVVHPSAHIAPDVHIGPHASIGAGVRVGAGSRIGANCVLCDGVAIGCDCRLYPQVTVYAGCTLGDRVILHSGCVVGSDGFGYALDEGRWLKVPQVGVVRIGNDVEVGSHTAIDRGALDDTVIEDGVKLDNLIQIAHNVRIGANTAIAACVGIAGSTRIGRDCRLGGAAMISGHLEITDGVTVSGGSLVAGDIREPGTYTSVLPLMPHGEWRRNAALIRHLDEMHKRLKTLEKRLSESERTDP
jgi:UDP-3-O-[3-hydroxymyristoyl] glucosamine N-acyltransferase